MTNKPRWEESADSDPKFKEFWDELPIPPMLPEEAIKYAAWQAWKTKNVEA